MRSLAARALALMEIAEAAWWRRPLRDLSQGTMRAHRCGRGITVRDIRFDAIERSGHRERPGMPDTQQAQVSHQARS